MPNPRTRLLVDWDKDGFGAPLGTYDDVTNDLYSLKGERGRDYMSQLLATSQAGKLVAELDNFTGTYSPGNSSSPLSGLLATGRDVLYTHMPPLFDYGVFNGSTSYITIPDHATIQNVFDSGGTVEVLPRLRSDGEGSTGALLAKGAWAVRAISESNGFVKLRFTMGFSTTAGVWETDLLIPLYLFSRIAIAYNASAVGNDPTVYLKRTDGNIQVLAVGDGLTETSTPVGTRTTDVGSALIIGNSSAAATETTDGDIDDVRIWTDIRTQTEVDDNAFVEIDPTSAGLGAYYRLQSDTLDETANNNDGTATAVTYGNDHIWAGRLHDIIPHPAQRGRKMATLEAFGILSAFEAETVEEEMATSVLSGTAFGSVLDIIGHPSADRDIDTGQETFDRFWSGQTSALRLLQKIEDSESGLIVEPRSYPLGIRFEDRHRRLLSPHDTSRVTFSDVVADSGVLRYEGEPQQLNPRQFIRNDWHIGISRYTVASSATLWTNDAAQDTPTGDPPAIAPGETVAFTAIYPNPSDGADQVGVDAWTTPTLGAGNDIEIEDADDGTGADISSDFSINTPTKRGNSMEFELTNNGAVLGHIVKMQARGTAVTRTDPVMTHGHDAASVTKYGRRSFPPSGMFENHFIGSQETGQAWADFHVATFSSEIPVLDFGFTPNVSNLHAMWGALLDVSDRITFKATTMATQLGINEDCFIENVKFSLGEDRILKFRYQISPTAGYSGFWVLGTSELGTAGGTVVAY